MNPTTTTTVDADITTPDTESMSVRTTTTRFVATETTDNLRSLVIPFKWGSGDSFELRYALRSWEKFGPAIQDCYLIGQSPNWYFGTVIEHEQTNRRIPSVAHVLQKLKRACMDMRITDELIFTNDDIFLVDKFKEGPFYMNNSPKRNDGGIHHKGFQLTFDELDRRGIRTRFDGELHAPIVYSKALALQILNTINCDLPYSFRTLYINLMNKQLAPMPDTKVFDWALPKAGAWFHSVNDTTLSNPEFKKWCEKNYPEPSRWEA